MEKLLNPYDKEYMKMAMLKHEEIFREQEHHHIDNVDSNKKVAAARTQCIDLEMGQVMKITLGINLAPSFSASSNSTGSASSQIKRDGVEIRSGMRAINGTHLQ
ncbi:hypothetical protein HAX54_047496 [Datura stramonium]|uniref:Uncharacterized protein n=1 Tax=Datura stramonium TaxID=4076 RepID=A0ABS8WN28_DATST|nr:hypothetical protein [Datura stramonium]